MKHNLGEKIKYFRKRSGLSQFQLEIDIDAALGSLSRIENGLVNPTKETLFEIARALSLDSYEVAYLFGIDLADESIALKDFIKSQLSDKTLSI